MLKGYDACTVSVFGNGKDGNRVSDASSDTHKAGPHSDKDQKRNGKSSSPKLSKRQKYLTLGFGVFLLIVGTGDIVSDWYNALTYRDNLDQFEGACNETTDEDQSDQESFYLSEIFIAVCLATLTYTLELIAFVLQVHYLRKNMLKLSVVIFQEVSSFATLILEDLIMAAIIYKALQQDECTLLEQMQTIAGKVAISFTTASVAFRWFQALNNCCTCTGCEESGCNSYCCVIGVCLPFRIIRTLATMAVLALVVFIILKAYF